MKLIVIVGLVVATICAATWAAYSLGYRRGFNRGLSLRNSTDRARMMRVQTDLQAISTMLMVYQSTNGTQPTSQQGLRALVEQPTTDPRPIRWYQLFHELPKDPWGHDYIYRSPAEITYEVFSAGPDGVPDTTDDIRKH